MLEGMEGLEAGYVLLSSPPTKAMSLLVFDSEEHMNTSAIESRCDARSCELRSASSS